MGRDLEEQRQLGARRARAGALAARGAGRGARGAGRCTWSCHTHGVTAEELPEAWNMKGVQSTCHAICAASRLAARQRVGLRLGRPAARRGHAAA